MNSLDRYILRQCLTPLAVFLAVATMLAWTTQSLQRMDILIDYRQNLGVFAHLNLFLIPSLLSLVIPFSLFFACAYALYRLHSDSEITVMYAAGVSRWRLAAPILLITLIGAAATHYINVDLMPRSYRIMKDKLDDIRADLASAVVRDGEFMEFSENLTIYVQEARPGGQFVGVFINDFRDESAPKTYMAERGLVRETENGPVLFLKTGNIQQRSEADAAVDIVTFDEFPINVSAYQNAGDEGLEIKERYARDLVNPDLTKPWERANARRFKAEGHARYAESLHAFAYVLIGLFAMTGGSYSRRGVLKRLAAAIAAVLTLRILGFIAHGVAESTGAHWALYAVPGSVVALCAYLLFFEPLKTSMGKFAQGTA